MKKKKKYPATNRSFLTASSQPDTFALRVVQARVNKDVKIRDLCRTLGISGVTYYRHLRSAESFPPYEIYQLYDRVLGLTATYGLPADYQYLTVAKALAKKKQKSHTYNLYPEGSFSHDIKQAMLDRGLTKQQLANELGISLPTLTYYFTTYRFREPTPYAMALFLTHMELPLKWKNLLEIKISDQSTPVAEPVPTPVAEPCLEQAEFPQPSFWNRLKSFFGLN